MALSKVQRNFQITLPAEIRKKIGIEVGDLVDFELTEEGILLKPQETINRSQAWFWSKEWQKEEKLVEKDFKKGEVLVSENWESFLKDLE